MPFYDLATNKEIPETPADAIGGQFFDLTEPEPKLGLVDRAVSGVKQAFTPDPAQVDFYNREDLRTEAPKPLGIPTGAKNFAVEAADKTLGQFEGAANIATQFTGGMAGQAVAGLTGLGTMATTWAGNKLGLTDADPLQAAAAVTEGTAKTLQPYTVYSPKTEEGKQIEKATGEVFETVLHEGGRRINPGLKGLGTLATTGDINKASATVTEAMENPTLADTAVNVLWQSAPILIPALKGGKAVVKDKVFNNYVDTLANKVYETGKFETPAEAKVFASEMVSKQIKNAGGWDNASMADALRSRSAVKKMDLTKPETVPYPEGMEVAPEVKLIGDGRPAPAETATPVTQAMTELGLPTTRPIATPTPLPESPVQGKSGTIPAEPAPVADSAPPTVSQDGAGVPQTVIQDIDVSPAVPPGADTAPPVQPSSGQGGSRTAKQLYRGDSVSQDGIGTGSVGDLGKGIYFTDSPNSAEYFTDGSDKAHTRQFPVSIKNPLDMMNPDTPTMQKIIADMPDGVQKTQLKKWVNNELDVKDNYGFIARLTGNTPETFNDFLAKYGYDSVVDQGVRGVSEGDQQYVIFDKSRIAPPVSPAVPPGADTAPPVQPSSGQGGSRLSTAAPPTPEPVTEPLVTTAPADPYTQAQNELDAIRPTIKPLTKPEPQHIVMDVQGVNGKPQGRIAAPYDGTKEDALRVAKALKLHASEDMNGSMRESAVYAVDKNNQPVYEFRQGEGVTEVFDVAPTPTTPKTPDMTRIQQLKDSIAEGQSIIDTGRFNGKKKPTSYIEMVRKQVAKETAELEGMEPTTPKPAPLRMDGTTRPAAPVKEPLPGFTATHPKTQEIFNTAIDTADTTTLKEILHMENKNLRAEFEARTGVKLGKSMTKTREAIDAWAQSVAEPVKTEPAEVEQLGSTTITTTGKKIGKNPLYSMPVNESRKVSLQGMLEEITAGEPGGKNYNEKADGEGGGFDVTGYSSSYPDYFRDKGYTFKDAKIAIEKVIAGQPVTRGQAVMVDDMLTAIRERDVARIKQGRRDDIQARLESYGMERASIDPITDILAELAEKELSTEDYVAIEKAITEAQNEVSRRIKEITGGEVGASVGQGSVDSSQSAAGTSIKTDDAGGLKQAVAVEGDKKPLTIGGAQKQGGRAVGLGELMDNFTPDPQQDLFASTSPFADIPPSGMAKPATNSDGQPIPSADNFRKWFGDSVVVDSQGRPLVVYHGTDADFTSFDRSKISPAKGLGGFWFTDMKKLAHGHSGPAGKSMATYLSLKNPASFETVIALKPPEGLPMDQRADWYSTELKRQGYDGFRFAPENENNIYVVLDPTQVKSASVNNGGYSSSNSNIHQSQSAYADIPADGMPRPETKEPMGDTPTTDAPLIRAMRNPELVKISRAMLDGRNPQIVKAIRGNPSIRGVFFAKDGGYIKLRADLAKDPQQLIKTLAHEIGHLVDYSPDQTMSRGNLLGRIASLNRYTKSLLEEYPDSPNKILTPEDRDRLRAEATRQLKAEEQKGDKTIIEEITREEPIFSETGLTPEMVLSIWNDVTSRNKYPELYRAVAQMQPSMKKAVIMQAMKGVVPPELAHIGGGEQIGTRTVTEKRTVIFPGKKATPADIKRRYEKLLKEEILKRRLYELETIKTELKDLSFEWRPLPEGMKPTDKNPYMHYRNKGTELYADAISSLLTSPGFLSEKAPTFTKAFFAYMERKPEFKAAFDGIQDTLGNFEGMAQGYVDDVYKMFRDAQDVRNELAARPEQTRSTVDTLMTALVDEEWAAKKITLKMAKMGGDVGDRANATMKLLGDMPYLPSETKGLLLELQDEVIGPMEVAGISIDDMGAYMAFDRILGEEGNKVAFQGHNYETSQIALAALNKKWGGTKFLAAEKYREIFVRKWRREQILKTAGIENFLRPEQLAAYTENSSYSRNNVTAYLDKNFGSGTLGRFKVYERVGSFEDIENPFVATVIQDLSLRKAIAVNNAKLSMVRTLADAGEVQPAVMRYSKDVKAQVPLPPEGKYLDTISAVVNGKMQYFYVDKDIARIFQYDPVVASNLAKYVAMIAQPFRDILVSKNPIFQVRNPIRDFAQTFKNTKEIGYSDLPKLFGTYMSVFPEVKAYAMTGKASPLIKQILKNKALPVNRIWSAKDETAWTELDRLAQTFVLDPTSHGDFSRGKLRKLYDFLDRTGATTELLGKVAGYKYLQDNTKLTTDEIVMRTRNFIGTPNWKIRGTLSPILNNVFMFSNVNIQGWASSYMAAKSAPFTYGMKTAVNSVMNRTLIWLAGLGALGVGLQEIVKRIPKSDKSNYNIIPLHLTDSGKAMYLRIPEDYTGQFMGQLTTAVLDGNLTGKGGISDATVNAIPYKLSNFVEIPYMLAKYMLKNENTYDAFYQRNVMTDDELKAGGKYAAEALGKESWNKSGLQMLYKFDRSAAKREQNAMEKALNTFPGTLAGTFLKTSDAGLREQFQEPREQAMQDDARDRINAKSAADKLLKGETLTAEETTAAGMKPDTIKGAIIHKSLIKDGQYLPDALFNARTKREKEYIVNGGRTQ